MLVDHERVLLDLKRHLATKPHHGARELATVIAGLEVRHEIEESLPERALRLYGLEFYEEAVRDTPTSSGDSVPEADGDQDRAPRGDSTQQSEEGTNGRNSTAATDRHQASSRRGPRVPAGV